MSKIKNIKGMKFNKLTAIEIDKQKSTSGRTYWLCKCDCGNPNLVSVYLYHLTSEKIKSCGCIKKEGIISHGDTVKDKKTRLYTIWDGMLQRWK